PGSSGSFLRFFCLLIRPPPRPPLFPYTTLFRSFFPVVLHRAGEDPLPAIERELEAYVAAGAGTMVLSAVTGEDGYDGAGELTDEDRKSTRLNSSHVKISYAVFCLKKKIKDEKSQ